jgi:ethanolamine utilization protein EutN
MQVARVVGEVVSTHKLPAFRGHKLLLVRNLDLQGAPEGSDYIALDTVDAGRGDRVLVNKEGGSARLALGDESIPVQALIVGVVDGLQLEGTANE